MLSFLRSLNWCILFHFVLIWPWCHVVRHVTQSNFWKWPLGKNESLTLYLTIFKIKKKGLQVVTFSEINSCLILPCQSFKEDTVCERTCRWHDLWLLDHVINWKRSSATFTKDTVNKCDRKVYQNEALQCFISVDVSLDQMALKKFAAEHTITKLGGNWYQNERAALLQFVWSYHAKVIKATFLKLRLMKSTHP